MLVGIIYPIVPLQYINDSPRRLVQHEREVLEYPCQFLAKFLQRGRSDLTARLKRDPAASSYWIERTPPGPKPESLGDQF